jgi:hypothetical protein
MRKCVVVLGLLMSVTGAWARPAGDPDKTFSVDVPEGWTVRTDDAVPDAGQALHTVRVFLPAAPNGAFTTNVGIQVLNSESPWTPAKQQEFVAELVKTTPGTHVQAQKSVRLAGLDAWRIDFECPSPQGPLRGFTELASHDGHSWIVTCMGSAARFGREESQIDGLLSSFKLL